MRTGRFCRPEMFLAELSRVPPRGELLRYLSLPTRCEACPHSARTRHQCAFLEGIQTGWWDMVRAEIGVLARACHLLGQMCMDVRNSNTPHPQTLGVAKVELPLIEEACRIAGLGASLIQTRRAAK